MTVRVALVLCGALLGCEATPTPPPPSRPIPLKKQASQAPPRARAPHAAPELAAAGAPIWGLSIPVGCRAQANWRDWQDFRCTVGYEAVERFYLHRYPTGRLVREARGARFDPQVGRTGALRLQRMRDGVVRILLFRGAATTEADLR